MKSTLAAGVALAVCASPALAQSMPMNMPMNMPGMAMPKAKPAAKKTTRKIAAAKRTAKKTHEAASRTTHKAAPAQAPPTMQMPMGGGSMAMPSSPQGTAASMPPMTMPMPPAAPVARSAMPGMQHGSMGMTMKAALGPYPEQRESSGTGWQPDASSAMAGPMTMAGGWMLMAHGDANLVYDRQSGPRGDSKAFVGGMLMGMAQHPLGNGALQFRAMLSPDPLMGPGGYPLLLASGETANGRDRLIDRQHPHDLFMELSAAASQNIGPKSSVFLYAGLPGEPAFGPPTFMHRESIEDSPEAPITHHWLDSTHITFGVVTAGLVLDRVKIEASRFNGREPDQHRWNIETGPLDSSSVRLSWNPTRTLALQGSWAHLVDPEQLEPGVNQTRWSASALWADNVAPGWHAAAMLAWGSKSSLGHHDDGFAAEASVRQAGWTVFGRGEMVENRELLDVEDGPAFRVGKVSLGAVRDFRIADHLSIGPGGLVSLNFVPDGLATLYGGHHPTGAMGFVRLKLD
ncbi:MAG TPA: hypothetical protein VFW39_05880 [Sphingomicrobium sp.]|nr:hypothetical protein [Sphingomicrobium sp.]